MSTIEPLDEIYNDKELEENYLSYKLDNFSHLGPIAGVIYTLLAFVDYSLAKEDLWKFLILRILFILPTAVFSQVMKSRQARHIDAVVFLSFFSAGIGVSLISIFLGGLQSDYYFGLLIISFVQFSFVPINKKLTALLDFSLFVFYFGSQIYFAEYQQDLLIKQVSNYLSFALLKAFILKRSSSLILGALKNLQLKKQLDNQKDIQGVLGELCHLFNNPLFISMTLLKKLKTENHLKDEDATKLQKVFEANERMNKVLQKMLNITKKDAHEKVSVKDLIN